MSIKVHGTTRAQARELGRRDNGLANEVRVSPDEFAGVAPRCDTEHDDPGLQPADFLRRHTEQQEINVIPIKTAVAVHRTRIARKSGAQQTSCLAHLRSVLFQNQCAVRCHRMSPGEMTLHMPVKKMSEDDSV